MQLASDKAGRSSHNYVQLRGFELETSAPVSATIGTGSSYHLIDGGSAREVIIYAVFRVERVHFFKYLYVVI